MWVPDLLILNGGSIQEGTTSLGFKGEMSSSSW